jgi:hypothetical protein
MLGHNHAGDLAREQDLASAVAMSEDATNDEYSEFCDEDLMEFWASLSLPCGTLINFFLSKNMRCSIKKDMVEVLESVIWPLFPVREFLPQKRILHVVMVEWQFFLAVHQFSDEDLMELWASLSMLCGILATFFLSKNKRCNIKLDMVDVLKFVIWPLLTFREFLPQLKILHVVMVDLVKNHLLKRDIEFVVFHALHLLGNCRIASRSTDHTKEGQLELLGLLAMSF